MVRIHRYPPSRSRFGVRSLSHNLRSESPFPELDLVPEPDLPQPRERSREDGIPSADDHREV